ncbi:MAG TPA: CHASE2 domain-containing protein [Methylophilaceae bacterium]|nr:CHASE2 domain-containing protein [Methylophilaceae bacterium]
MIRLKLFITQWLANITRKLRNNFYLYLAAVLTVLVLLDAGVFHIAENMRERAFDVMVRNRVIVPEPDKDIVIIDINEASLAAMAEEYGRWPWPRQVFGEFLESIQAQNPKAVVFDILFSDADIYNPDSDAYFNEVIANTDNTFFPFLRLSEEHDALSQVKPAMIPVVEEEAPGSGDPDTTIAVVLPHFTAALESGRLGTHNIYPDKDGIVRQYRLYQTDDGWKIPSLPLTIAQSMDYAVPKAQDVLLNWRGGPFTYKYVSFSDVMHDMTSKEKKRPQDEFTGKTVIIGSTAPSLFDLKATAMAKAHPGVEILATAIDNLKHDDFLRVWRGTIPVINVSLPYVLISLLLIWLTAAAFYFNADRDKFNKLFSSSQIMLLALSFVFINVFNTYFDLAGPVTWAIGYFSIAKIYALATDRALQRGLAFEVQPGQSGIHVLLMPIIIESPEPLGDALLKKLKRQLESAVHTAKDVEILRGTQHGIWGLFCDTVIVNWVHEKKEDAEKARVEAEQLGKSLPTLLGNIGLPPSTPVRYILHEETMTADNPAAGQWRALFARAIARLEASNPTAQAQST